LEENGGRDKLCDGNRKGTGKKKITKKGGMYTPE
jgi:hypothetical protein